MAAFWLAAEAPRMALWQPMSNLILPMRVWGSTLTACAAGSGRGCRVERSSQGEATLGPSNATGYRVPRRQLPDAA